MKLAVIFGGMSTEHDISIVSASNILVNLDKNKYNIYPIYISKEGLFYEYKPDIYKVLNLNEEINDLYLINNIFDYLKEMDVVFPILHGEYGEDGSIQGLLKLLKIPYVGCEILASSICMDKDYTKRLLKLANINVVDSIIIKKNSKGYEYIDNYFNSNILNNNELINLINDKLKFPVFVKSSNSGSSIGVYKVNSKDELFDKINESFIYDSKVLIEKEIMGREVECAILGNNELIVSDIGEIIKEDYYSFNAKYKSNTLLDIPSKINNDLKEVIRNIAIKAYKVCNCTGLSRIDFFIEKDTNNIYLNEINTMPGFTKSSMYPKLLENIGYSYSKLLDKLIELAINK